MLCSLRLECCLVSVLAADWGPRTTVAKAPYVRGSELSDVAFEFRGTWPWTASCLDYPWVGRGWCQLPGADPRTVGMFRSCRIT